MIIITTIVVDVVLVSYPIQVVSRQAVRVISLFETFSSFFDKTPASCSVLAGDVIPSGKSKGASR